MSWPSILIYYVLAALLTFHLTGIVGAREGAVKTAAPATTPFLEAVPDRIDRIRMEEPSLSIQFEKKDGRWIVTEPEGISPPGDVIDAVLDSFTSLPPIEIVSEGVENQAQFGLVPPRVRVRIEQQGTLVSTIVIGERSPTGTAVYAKKSGSEDVALIGLNAKYYIDLVFENVRRQRSSTGVSTPVPAPAGTGVPAPAAAPGGTETK